MGWPTQDGSKFRRGHYTGRWLDIFIIIIKLLSYYKSSISIE